MPKQVFFDGSADSHRSVKARIRSIFSFSSRQSEDSSLMRRDSLRSQPPPPQSSADTTVIKSPRMQIVTGPSKVDRDFLCDLPQMIQHGMPPDGIGSQVQHKAMSNCRALRRSQSSPGLTHKISHRICQTFGDPTIVHRGEMRSRPSLREINYLPDCTLPVIDSSQHASATSSTYKSRNSSSPARRQLPTAPTSDSQTDSAGVLGSPAERPISKKTFLILPTSAESVVRKLSTISETTLPNIPSIVTVGLRPRPRSSSKHISILCLVVSAHVRSGDANSKRSCGLSIYLLRHSDERKKLGQSRRQNISDKSESS